MYYKYTGDMTKLLSRRPRLMKRTVVALDSNLKMMADLATGKEVKVEKRRMQEVMGLLRAYRNAAGAKSDLGKAVSMLARDLKNEKLLAQLGVTLLN
jgi:hypothetical protein